MKRIKKIIVSLLLLVLMASFFQCSSSKMLQKNLPFEIGKAYYQESTSGIHIFIPMKSNPNNILLDSVYFKGKQIKLEHKDKLFVGMFKTNRIEKRDIIMSNEPYAEYGNKVPNLTQKARFELKEHECMVSYKEDGTIKYFKIKNITSKETQVYP